MQLIVEGGNECPYVKEVGAQKDISQTKINKVRMEGIKEISSQ